MGVIGILAVAGFTVVITIGLLLLAISAPTAMPRFDSPGADDDARPIGGPNPTEADGGDRRPRLRLLSRLLFSRRHDDAITIDCLLLSVEQPAPGIDPSEGLPFTLELRTPDTAWFAERVEELLDEWAAESRELLLELREDQGKVRTRIAAGDSAVHLELSGAAGLTLSS